jgi:hypothetical protein
MSLVSNLVRWKGDPQIVESGRSSLDAVDRMARSLGWFGIWLGAGELFLAPSLTRLLGMQGMEPLVRLFGAREIASGIVSLSVDKKIGIWSRVAGDAMDIAVLAKVISHRGPQRNNAKTALALVIGVTALDVYAAQRLTARQQRPLSELRSYARRSGFPNGIAAARGKARNGHFAAVS